jgi:hypothetical protein
MLGCEIIEAAEQGEIRFWSPKRTAIVLSEHGQHLSDFVDQYANGVPQVRYRADAVLLWLGY